MASLLNSPTVGNPSVRPFSPETGLHHNCLTLAVWVYVLVLCLGGLSKGATGDTEILDQLADEYGLQGEARALLYVIRIVEAGAPGREMGVLTPAAQRYRGDHARSLRLQAQWAAGTIAKRYTGDLAAFAVRWYPLGAANDPLNLNRYWLANARYWMPLPAETILLARAKR